MPLKAVQPGAGIGLMRGVVFAGLLVYALGQTILFALMGPAAREIGMPEWQVGAIVSASAVVFVFASPMWGRLADRLSRRAVFVFGLFGYGAATLLFAWLLDAGLNGWIGAATTFSALLAARLLYALLAGGIQPAAVALMADLTSRTDRSAGMVLVGAGFGLGSVLGPAFAAALVGFGLLVPLFAAAGLAILVAMAALVFLRPPSHKDADADSVAPKVPLGRIAPFLALAFGIYLAIAALQQTTAFYIQDFTQSNPLEAARLSGFAFMTLAAAILLVQGGVVQLLKPSPALMLGLGVPIAAIGIAAYALAPGYGWLLAAFGVMGVGFGLAQPGVSAAVSLRIAADAQGGAAGLVQAAMAGGFVVGPIAGTLLYTVNPRGPMMLSFASLLLCGLLFLAALRRTTSQGW